MGRKRHPPEQIITALREAEVGLARGKSVKLISRAPASREERCDCGGAREAHGAHTPDFIERALSWDAGSVSRWPVGSFGDLAPRGAQMSPRLDLRR